MPEHITYGDVFRAKNGPRKWPSLWRNEHVTGTPLYKAIIVSLQNSPDDEWELVGEEVPVNYMRRPKSIALMPAPRASTGPR